MLENKKNNYIPHTQTTTISEGMSWPSEQSLPIFATPASSLDIISMDHLGGDEKVTFGTLQGIVNKEKPRISIYENKRVWFEYLEFEKDSIIYNEENKYDLVAKYKDYIKGFVIYNTEKSGHYRNLAGSIANANQGYIPVTSQIMSELAKINVDFSDDKIIDISNLTMTSEFEIAEYLYDNYWDKLSKRLIFLLEPLNSATLANRDLAAATGAALFYFEVNSEDGQRIYKKFLKDMATNMVEKNETAIILGYPSEEATGISPPSKYGIGTVPSDFYYDATVFAGHNHVIKIPKVPKRPALENKVYIALHMSDGDNIQYAQRGLRDRWLTDADSRGKIALNWTITPALADIGPGIMNYFYENVTDKECFSCGPSGMGYLKAYNGTPIRLAPRGNNLTDRVYADKYVKQTEMYIQRTGLRSIVMSGGMDNTVKASFEENCRYTYGLIVEDGDNLYPPEASKDIINDRLFVERSVYNNMKNYDLLLNDISNHIENRDDQVPEFYTYNLNVWTVDIMNTKNLVKLQETLQNKYPGNEFEIVRADHYFSYFCEAKGLPFNLTMQEATKVTSSDNDGKPENVMDGSNATMWKTSNAGEKYLEFDFSKNYSINRYVINHAEVSGLPQSHNVKSWKVEVSTDGKAWEEVDTYRSNTLAVTDIDISPVNARYLKITILDRGDCSECVEISGVDIYGKNM